MTRTTIRLAAAAAALALLSAPGGAAVQAQPAQAPGATATPRTADGHPDLSGYWGAGPPGGGAFATGPIAATGGDGKSFISPMNVRNGDISNLTNDGVIGRRSGDNLPLYKPQYWEKVEDLDFNGNRLDPFNVCMPPGVPRMGPPRRIVVLPNEVMLFYAITFQRNDARVVPIGPRTHQPDRDGTWLGDPVAHWDGDALVIETIGFNDQTWIGPQGYLHGYDMKVTERFRRQGNRLIYDTTVEDPEYLQRPWVRDPVTLNLIAAPGYRMEEAPPCADRDIKNQVGKQREM